MNTLFLFASFILAFTPPLVHAQVRPAIYPFDVSVGGQAAVYSPDFPLFVRVENPVAADAEVVLGTGEKQIIVNIFPCNKDGTVPAGARPKAIMVAKGTGFKLDQTMDKSKLAEGLYGMNIVIAELGTSRVMFRVGAGTPGTVAAPATRPAGGAPDQSTPEKALAAVFAAAKSGDLAPLKALVPASGDLDGDVERIRDVADADAAAQKEFKEWFGAGKVVGAARIDADTAEVDFTFGPKGTRSDTMKLVRKDGKWFLDSF